MLEFGGDDAPLALPDDKPYHLELSSMSRSGNKGGVQWRIRWMKYQ